MEEMPSGMERRLVLQLLSHWRRLCGEQALPSFADVDPAAMPDLWPNCFVLDVAGHRDDPVFRAAGAVYAAFADIDLCNRRLSELPRNTLAEKSTSYVQEVIAKEVPISRGGEFVNAHGTTILFRSIMLPMSDDGKTLSGLLGAANCREASLGD